MAGEDSKSSEKEATEPAPSKPTEETAKPEKEVTEVAGPAEGEPKADYKPVEPPPAPPEESQPSPLITNTNRPPSVNSTHSGASGGNAASSVRTTLTSRRGGRIRSRSPAILNSRPSPPADFPEAGGRDPRSHSPKNPSSAAAAAAAAAKALSKGSGKSGWGGSGRQDHRGEPPRYYDQGNAYGGPPQGQGWPGEGGDGRVYAQDGRHTQAIHRGRPYEQGFGDGHQRSERRHPNEYHGQYDNLADYDNRRYGYGDNTRGGRGGEAPPFDQRGMRQDFFNGPAGMAPIDGSSPVPPPLDNTTMPLSYASPTKTSGAQRDVETPSTVKRRGGTSRVIGTPTPIHVPRAADPPNSQFASQGSAASVFRGRPDDAEAPKPPTGNAEDETPQRLLLSLRTPTTSFEENKSSSKGPPLSPEEPPKIQHAHQQRGDQPLMFEVSAWYASLCFA